MPIWEGKLVTTAEYRKLKNKGAKKITKEVSLIGANVYWFGPQQFGLPLFEGIIVEHNGDKVIVDTLNRSLSINPNRERKNIEMELSDILFDKKK